MATRICPKCGSTRLHRRRYMGPDFMRSLNPVRRYICDACGHTYLGLRLESREQAAARWSQRTHLTRRPVCPRCGNSDVQRVDRRSLRFGFWGFVWRVLRMSPNQCRQCRGQFFSVQPASPDLEARHREG